MNLATIPAQLPFLDTLARSWLDESVRLGVDPGDGMILLPTRRAARALTEAFLRATGGAPLLLPRIVAVGALDEAPLALDGALDLPPAVEETARLAVLTRLILALEGRYGAPRHADLGWRMAIELARLLDEAQRAEIDLAGALPQAVEAGFGEAFARHWQVTLEFLVIVTQAWPAWLAERGLMDPAARQSALLRAQAAAWERAPPDMRVLAAGIGVTTPALEALLRSILTLPRGQLLLAGLDQAMAEADWEALSPTHPQYGMRRLLERLGARRADIRVLEAVPVAQAAPEGRVRLLGQALLPEQAIGAWLHDRSPAMLTGLARLDPADTQEEASAIAMILRAALDMPGRRAALVTPDRQLAARVVAELSRWGVAVDDSAGESLSLSPPAVFLRLMLAAAEQRFAPVALLALLKHPLAAAGLPAGVCRDLARRLELACLRGPAPAPGLAGLRALLAAGGAGEDDAGSALPAFLDRLETALGPLVTMFAAGRDAVPDQLTALLEAAEALAATEAIEPGGAAKPVPGAARLWSQEEGSALADHLAALVEHSAVLPPQPPRYLAGLLEASLDGLMVRSRRALRGRGGMAGEHPRLFIWGLLEARLQSVEVMVLGGLAETLWPPATDPGPWMSRPMRAAIGLEPPEMAVGQAAQDFVLAACAAPEVVLSCAARRDDTPLVPSRWLVRLRAFLDGRSQALPVHPALRWSRQLDQPEGPARPAPPPRPRPPVALRPRRLSVTEIETWQRDPYAIYARHVLRLRPLDPLQQGADHADYGSVVHDALKAFFEAHPRDLPPDAEARLEAAMERAVSANAALRPALAAWWRPRLARIAGWVVQEEAARRAEAAPETIAPERRGRCVLHPEGAVAPFTLTARADRLDRLPDGRLAILDYKTGTVPSRKDVGDGWASQLPLEAAMAARGGFGADMAGEAASLTYWRLSGGDVPGAASEACPPEEVPALAEAAWAGLAGLIVQYDDPAQPYLSHPRPGEAPRYADYHHLARVAEWSVAQEDGA